jgi:leader peptidase (prepilin peptidase)/N-methyltransferase
MMAGVVGGFALAQVFLVPVWFQEPEIARMLSAYTPGWLEQALGPMTVPQVDWSRNREFMGRMARLEIPAWVRTFPHLHGLAVSLAGLVIGGGIVWVLRIIGQFVLKREAMGFGDVVLMATIGSFLGWQPTVTVFFVAPVCALAVLAVQWLGWLLHSAWRGLRNPRAPAESRRGPREIPYGPYLSLAALLTILGWKSIWPIAQWWFAFGPIVLIAFVVIPAAMFASLQLFQGIKRLAGVPLYDEAPAETFAEQWTPADQLLYLQGENVDRLRGRWTPQHDWPGTAAGRGTAQLERWRNGTPR